MTRTRLVVGLALVGIVAACSSATGSPAASGSAAPANSPALSAAPTDTATAECQPLDLVLPSGEPLDLTGSWLGNDDGLYQVRQYGRCVWWVGQTDTWVHLLHGTVSSDLTVSASWATVASSNRGTPADPGFVPAGVRLGRGMWVLTIEIGESGTNEDLRLVKVSGTDSSSGGIRTTEWTRVDDDPDHPLPPPAS